MKGASSNISFDPITKEHPHIICGKCDNITDICGGELDKIRVPKNIQKKYGILSKK